MAKSDVVMNQVREFLENTDKDIIKINIGDSIDNSRTPSTNQVIRYLSREGATRSEKKLARNLSSIFINIRSINKRSLGNRIINRRTDAYDINELIKAYDFHTSTTGSTIKRMLSKDITV